MNEELNKKLAEWAELKLAEEPDYTGFYLFADTEGICHTANFTQSLDACFKWLWDKAVQGLADTDLSSLEEAIQKLFQLWAIEWVTKLHDAPALALCKVIEKLIDEDK